MSYVECTREVWNISSKCTFGHPVGNENGYFIFKRQTAKLPVVDEEFYMTNCTVLTVLLMLDIIWNIGHCLKGTSCSVLTLLSFSFWKNDYQMRSWSHLSGQGCQMHFFLGQLLVNIKQAIVLQRQRTVQFGNIVGVSWQAYKQKLSFCFEKRQIFKYISQWATKWEIQGTGKVRQ